MSREMLLNVLRRRPFQPVRLFVSDGGSYDIRHPELVLVEPAYLAIGVPDPDLPPPAAAGLAHVSILHVTGVEPISLSAGAKPQG